MHFFNTKEWGFFKFWNCWLNSILVKLCHKLITASPLRGMCPLKNLLDYDLGSINFRAHYSRKPFSLTKVPHRAEQEQEIGQYLPKQWLFQILLSNPIVVIMSEGKTKLGFTRHREHMKQHMGKYQKQFQWKLFVALTKFLPIRLLLSVKTNWITHTCTHIFMYRDSTWETCAAYHGRGIEKATFDGEKNLNIWLQFSRHR